MRRLGLAIERSTACVAELVATSASRFTNCGIPPLLTRRLAPAGPSAATNKGADSIVVVLTASLSAGEPCANAASIPSDAVIAANANRHRGRGKSERRIWSRESPRQAIDLHAS